MMAVHWRYYKTELSPDFWTLTGFLDAMSTRWSGHHRPTGATPGNIATKYCAQLKQTYIQCQNDTTFKLDVLGYSNEIEWNGRNVSGEAPALPSNHQAMPRPSEGPDMSGHEEFAAFKQPYMVSTPSLGTGQGPAPILLGTASEGMGYNTGSPDELTAVTSILLDQQYSEMDRIISLNNANFVTDMAYLH